ncbi:MAG: DsrE/DsrF/DrsH-like family protein, partial [Chitinivibrionales bacterium]|nr:DsrE/DsrF/DrsH-like family protein [Chitinivibrionales bacterium]
RSPDVCTVAQTTDASNKKTFILFSNDLDKVMAAFIIANAAASLGQEVTIFFTFWGLNLLRKDSAVAVQKSFMEKMFGMMMPSGPQKTVLSKMNMAGLGTKLMAREMKKKHVFSLPELMAQAREKKIRFIACAMSMDIMGIKKEELIDGVELGGVTYYLEHADASSYNLFI